MASSGSDPPYSDCFADGSLVKLDEARTFYINLARRLQIQVPVKVPLEATEIEDVLGVSDPNVTLDVVEPPTLESTEVMECSQMPEYDLDISFDLSHRETDDTAPIQEEAVEEEPMLTETLLEDTPLHFDVIESGSQRGYQLLVDSHGYTYGVKSFTVQDSKVASLSDLGIQFFLREDDVKQERNRAEASAVSLRELNPYVSIRTLTTQLDDTADLQYLKDYQFISADVYGLFAGAFCDFGDKFEVSDPNGEEPKEAMIANITKANPGVVTCLDNKMHGFESDDTVTFKEVQGMETLNGRQCTIKVLSPYAFSICDTSGEEFGNYENGGIVSQVKIGKACKFESLETQLGKPEILIADFSKFEVPISAHAGIVAIHKFQEKNGRLPNVWCDTDAAEVLSVLGELKSKGMFANSGDISDDMVKLLSYTCRGCFVPLCAAMGGIVAQEGIKAITGKFMPLNQWVKTHGKKAYSKARTKIIDFKKV